MSHRPPVPRYCCSELGDTCTPLASAYRDHGHCPRALGCSTPSTASGHRTPRTNRARAAAEGKPVFGPNDLANLLPTDGDYDPSGTHIFSSLAEDVQALARDLGMSGKLALATYRQSTTDRRVTSQQVPGLPAAGARWADDRAKELVGSQRHRALFPGVIRASRLLPYRTGAHDRLMAPRAPVAGSMLNNRLCRHEAAERLFGLRECLACPNGGSR
jgi:hypothetical protein